jgi:exonuclease III
MAIYKLDLLGLSETRWNGCGEFITASGELLLYSGRANEEKHKYGVGLILSKDLWKSLTEWTAVSESLIAVRIMTRLRKLTIVQCYTPTNEATIEEKETFYDLLEATLHQIRQSDIVILMGDLNAKIGNVNLGFKNVMSRHGLGTRNENGHMLIDLCVNCNLVIGGSLFPHKDIHKATWVAPNQRTFNQIDHTAISKKWRRSLLDVHSYRGADVASDHHLVMAQLRLKLAITKISSQRLTRKKFNIKKFTHGESRRMFEEELKESLNQGHMNELNPSEHWSIIKEVMLAKGENILGLNQRNYAKGWITEETWNKINCCKITKQKINNANDETRPTLLAEYSQINKRVKRYARCDKQAYADKLAHKAQLAADTNNSESYTKSQSS